MDYKLQILLGVCYKQGILKLEDSNNERKLVSYL